MGKPDKDTNVPESTRIIVEQKMQQAARMAAVGTLANGIAHNFNNMICAILGNAELLRCSFDEDDPNPFTREEQIELVKNIVKACTQAKETTSSLMELSRESLGKFRDYDIAKVVREAVKLYRNIIPAGIDIVIEIDPDTGIVYGDPHHVNQIINNLITNAYHAIKATEREYGEIKIELFRKNIVEGDKDFCATEPGNYAILIIKDTGCGMDDDTIKKIFDPLFTTKAPYEGTGLGLTMTYKQIKENNGDITVTSAPGVGTTFSICLPLSTNIPQSDLPSRPSKIFSGNARILVVDDEQSISKFLTIQLKRWGFDVKTFNNAPQAADFFLNNQNDFDLIISDLNMPGMQGTRLIEICREIRSDIRTILISGVAEIIDIADLKDPKPDTLLHKPFNRDDLIGALEIALRNKK